MTRAKFVRTSFLLFLLISSFGCSSLISSSELQIPWMKTYSYTLGVDKAVGILQTPDKGFILIANVGDNTGWWDGWVLKTDPDGRALWNQTYDNKIAKYSEDLDEFRSGSLTLDGGVILAGYRRHYTSYKESDDCWVVKTDCKGDIMWNYTYGKMTIAESIIQTKDGAYAIAGVKNHTFWLLKINNKGGEEWSQTYTKNLGGNRSYERAHDLIQTSDGGFLLTGYTQPKWRGPESIWVVKTNIHGEMEWNQTYGSSGIDVRSECIQTQGNGFLLAGYICISDIRGYSDWVIKINENGEQEWNQTYENALFGSIIQLKTGDFALVGSISNGADTKGWLVKINNQGVTQWNQTYNDGVVDLVQTDDGGFALVGWTNSYYPPHLWLIRTDSNGTSPPIATSVNTFEMDLFPLVLFSILALFWYKKRKKRRIQ
ncbi:MAG: hypothetical protein ACFFCZ_02780 [Promethearchaeota archaeon]